MKILSVGWPEEKHICCGGENWACEWWCWWPNCRCAAWICADKAIELLDALKFLETPVPSMLPVWEWVVAPRQKARLDIEWLEHILWEDAA